MIGSTTNQASYAGNGSSVTSYVIPFRYDAAGWVHVTLTDAAGVVTDLEQVVDYTLSGDGLSETGYFRTILAYAADTVLTVHREAPGIQSLSLENNVPFPAASLESQLDRVAMAANDRVTGRAMEARIREIELTPGPQGEKGDPADIVSYAFEVNEGGDLIMSYSTGAPDMRIENGDLILTIE